MPYVKTNWQEGITPISPTNMNKIEQGIKDNEDNLNSHLTDYANFKDQYTQQKLNIQRTLSMGGMI